MPWLSVLFIFPVCGTYISNIFLLTAFATEEYMTTINSIGVPSRLSKETL